MGRSVTKRQIVLIVLDRVLASGAGLWLKGTKDVASGVMLRLEQTSRRITLNLGEISRTYATK